MGLGVGCDGEQFLLRGNLGETHHTNNVRGTDAKVKLLHPSPRVSGFRPKLRNKIGKKSNLSPSNIAHRHTYALSQTGW